MKTDKARRVYAVKRTGIALFVTEQRLKLNLTQKEFADYSGISIGAIRDIERGSYKLTVGMIHRLSVAFKCDVPDELVLDYFCNRDVKDNQFQIYQTLLQRIKKMLGISSDNEVVYKALTTLKLLLDKQNDGYSVSFKNGDTFEELKLPF